LFNGIKTLREETKSLSEEILGVKLNLKNLTKEEFYEFLKATAYAEKALVGLKTKVQDAGKQMVTYILVAKVIIFSLGLVTKLNNSSRY
jgi:hypothetical protein